MIKLPPEIDKEWYFRGYYGTLNHNAKACLLYTSGVCRTSRNIQYYSGAGENGAEAERHQDLEASFQMCIRDRRHAGGTGNPVPLCGLGRHSPGV